ncbi:MAG: 2-amino-4-hydroxy-6-hydroxymethyldihydropteridine diphosphokinase [Oxalobacteraceae bacterium]|jgi:2-amino-4-hydroxy-6-hydroxymethyldihydropteridine diphosphokinase|nr:2-amino-4-hydroxy-6-hydroxymethyldihydropteridine diphosphokinase [Oxalobacteraceae bacterium]
METITSYVGIGANLGDSLQNVKYALDKLKTLPHTQLHSFSSLYKSAPVDAQGDDYINAVARLDTHLAAASLLAELQKIELIFGRERPFINAPRTLDLDLLLYGQSEISTDSLVVPHPRMMNRAFVLLPLLELDPAIHVPGAGVASSYMSMLTDQTIHALTKDNW